MTSEWQHWEVLFLVAHAGCLFLLRNKRGKCNQPLKLVPLLLMSHLFTTYEKWYTYRKNSPEILSQKKGEIRVREPCHIWL